MILCIIIRSFVEMPVACGTACHQEKDQMKLSTKGRYGLRVLLDISTHQAKGPVILRDISQRQDISEKYLWQVINPLKAAGLVNSSRGAKGGYVLAKSPEDITVLDAVSILEGPVCVVDCVGAPESCERSGGCVTREVWGKVERSIKEAMGRITLKELIDKQKDKEAGGDLTYVI
jgi:Rrf2 family protein